ncbi:ABC transporter substrate-binding protein [Beduini massiliensis]|uniref:ABC transporter substrate-binding protein n=1 Tax=Beduini massiliensis TaxID=1585974 RepID=UPI00059AB2C0|nr:ABC transporter substrate-binding protein [Beduini massiliensis]
MKKIRHCLFCLLLSLSLLGCQAGQKNNPQPNHLNAAMFWISTSLDPTNDYDGWVLSRIGVGETLFRLNEAFEVEPWLADSYQQVDDTTWQFHIREGIRFSNGNVVDGESVKSCIERAFTKNARAKDYFDLSHVEASGQNVTVYLNTASGAVINNLCEPLFTIYDASENEDKIQTSPSCTGAFVIDQFVPETTIDSSANKNYWDGQVGLETVHFTQVADSDSRVLALQSGEVDLVTTIDYSNLSLFSDESKYTVSQVLGPRCNVVYMNNTSQFLSDQTLRQALSYAIDRHSIVQLTGGKEALGLYSSALPYGEGITNAYDYNPKEAIRLLDQAGYVDSNGDGIREINGRNIVIEYYESADHGSSDASIIAQSIQNEAKEIGISIHINQVENLADIKASGTFDMCSANDSTAPTGDPEVFLQFHYRSGAKENIARYTNPTVDQMILTLAGTFDIKERQELSKEISEILLEDAVSLYVSYLPLNTITSSKVKGANQHPVDYYMVTKDIRVQND